MTPVFMTLDMQGRLVANMKVILASDRIKKEIDAASRLARELYKKEIDKK